jgi:dihydropyrimidinase
VTNTVVRGGTIVDSRGSIAADLLITDGIIDAIGKFPELRCDFEVDATGKLVLPGGVDVHTHFATPYDGGVTDDFLDGTSAALAGGTTTVVNFALPASARAEESLDLWRSNAEGRAVSDFGFHQVLTPRQELSRTTLDRLVRDGISSIKLFLAPSFMASDDRLILRTMNYAAERGLLVMAHCENGAVIDELVERELALGHTAPRYHARAHPVVVEAEATNRVIALAKIAKVPVYIVHVSSADALTAVERAREGGQDVYAETCPHYLLLNEDLYERPDAAKYLVSPPLRAPEHSDALWAGLASGALQTVATDHAAICWHGVRNVPGMHFAETPYGMMGVEWRLSLVYHHGVRTGRLSLERFVGVVSTGPAKLFGLFPRKGQIAVGSDGDVVVFDPNRKRTIRAAEMVTRCDFTPYEDFSVQGSPETVLLRGEPVVEDGIVARNGPRGSYVARGESAALTGMAL